MRRVSSGVNGVIPEIFTGVNFPESSTIGKLPGDRMRSLTFVETPSIASNRAGIGIGFDAGATGVKAFWAAASTLGSATAWARARLRSESAGVPIRRHVFPVSAFALLARPGFEGSQCPLQTNQPALYVS